MFRGVERIDHRRQRLLACESVQLDDPRPRRLVQRPGRLKNIRRTVRTWLPAQSPGKLSARSATALYTSATSQPINCNGPRRKRGRLGSGLCLS
jgi:hypothetical protein